MYQRNFTKVTKTKGRRIHLSFPKKIRTWLIDFQGHDLLNIWVYFQIPSSPPPTPLEKDKFFRVVGGREKERVLGRGGVQYSGQFVNLVLSRGD